MKHEDDPIAGFDTHRRRSKLCRRFRVKAEQHDSDFGIEEDDGDIGMDGEDPDIGEDRGAGGQESDDEGLPSDGQRENPDQTSPSSSGDLMDVNEDYIPVVRVPPHRLLTNSLTAYSRRAIVGR